MQQTIPAAQYLRVSTHSQEYSVANQAAFISKYAAKHNFEIVSTYRDEAKSGLTFERRTGIQRLLQDVLDKPPFKAILVYDISRWGRFQDADEAGHYEFMCRSAGIPVHYCADNISTSNSVSDVLLKSVKRALAAEYSRQLGERVLQGQRRIVSMGFSTGGPSPYGFRRLLVDRDGCAKQFLQPGERKYLNTDHTRFVPGPEDEVQTVQRIFEMAAHYSRREIAEKLNLLGMTFRGKPWNWDRVSRILDEPIYRGIQVWGRKTARLQSPLRSTKTSEWVWASGKLPAIIGEGTYEQVKPKIRCQRVSDEEILDFLRAIHHEEGSVNTSSITTRTGPTYGTIVRHFGTLRHALERIGSGFPPKGQDDRPHQRRRLRYEVGTELIALFPGQVEPFVGNGKTIRALLVDKRHSVAIIVVPRHELSRKKRWLVRMRTPISEYALCCLMDENHKTICKTYLLKWPRRKPSVLFRENGAPNAIEVSDLRDFYRCVLEAARVVK